MSQYPPAGQYPDPAYPQGPNPGQPGYPQGAPQSKALAITALILGILAVLSFWTLVGGYLLGIAAIVFGIIALLRARSGGRGMAITGVILGALGLLGAIIMTIVGVSVFKDSGGTDFLDCVSKAGGDQAKIDQCQRDWNEKIEDKFSVTLTPEPTP